MSKGKQNRWGRVAIEHEGSRYELDTYSENDHIHKALKASGNFYEIDTLEWVRSRQRAGNYIDIGANIGNHTLWFCDKCPSTKVIAVEGNDAVLKILRCNIERAKSHPNKVHVIPKFISTTRYVEFLPADDLNIGMSSVRQISAVGAPDGNQVEAITLDDLSAQLDNVAFVKIDVEGHELEVIESGRVTLRRHRPDLLIESWEYPGKLCGILGRLGYCLTYSDEQHNFGFVYTGRAVVAVSQIIYRLPVFLRKKIEYRWRALVKSVF